MFEGAPCASGLKGNSQENQFLFSLGGAKTDTPGAMSKVQNCSSCSPFLPTLPTVIASQGQVSVAATSCDSMSASRMPSSILEKKCQTNCQRDTGVKKKGCWEVETTLRKGSFQRGPTRAIEALVRCNRRPKLLERPDPTHLQLVGLF